jgi:glycosyltransferase A (GT-A) superfamily protein (DUF2064 family)
VAAPVTDPGVLVMAPAGEPAPLEAVLGIERAAALQRLLLARALRWGRGVAGDGGVFVGSVAPAEDERQASAAAPAGVPELSLSGDTAGERLMGGIAQVASRRAGPVLVAWPLLAVWKPPSAAAALGDLAAGCRLSVGPVFDGGFYLLAVPGPADWLAAMPEPAWSGTEAMGAAIAAVHASHGVVGMLRAERALRRPGDVQAALADPLLDAELRGLLASE